MSRDSHTPGPWIADRALSPDNTGGYDYSIHTGDGKILAEVYEHVGYLDRDTRELDKRPVAANAILIASAPEMVELLACFVDLGVCGSFRSEDQEAYNECVTQCEELLKRIRGEGS